MNEPQTAGVWFIYDGECPLCSAAAQALRIQHACGPLHLIDARTNGGSPLLQDIRSRGLNLDEGMVIRHEGRFYHGKDALMFMARFGEDHGFFNRINRLLCRSNALARISYPYLRATRNFLLWVKGTEQINNLADQDAAIFAKVFGSDWEILPPVMRRHYANRSGHDDVVTVEGFLDVESSPVGRLLRPAFRLAKTLVPYEGKDVPVTVHFKSYAGSNAFAFERAFHFPGRPPCAFRSAMIPVSGNQVVEMMGLGLGWHMAYTWDGQKVILAHRGYVLRIFGLLIPLPLTFLLGAGYAEEIPLDNDRFAMMTEIRHPWWGRVFGYRGTFLVTKDR